MAESTPLEAWDWTSNAWYKGGYAILLFIFNNFQPLKMWSTTKGYVGNITKTLNSIILDILCLLPRCDWERLSHHFANDQKLYISASIFYEIYWVWDGHLTPPTRNRVWDGNPKFQTENIVCDRHPKPQTQNRFHFERQLNQSPNQHFDSIRRPD